VTQPWSRLAGREKGDSRKRSAVEAALYLLQREAGATNDEGKTGIVRRVGATSREVSAITAREGAKGSSGSCWGIM